MHSKTRLNKTNADFKKITFVGTANLGSNYGPHLKSGKFPEGEIDRLLGTIAEDSRIYLDTADSYRNSQELIGKFAPNKLNNKIKTKIRIRKGDDFQSIVKIVQQSLSTVKQDHFYSVLVHNSEELEDRNLVDIFSGLNLCVQKGLTAHIGMSCYESKTIIKMKNLFSSLDHFQIQENIISQENFDNMELNEVANSKSKIFVRSIFLQGLLLMNTNELPEYISSETLEFKNFENFCNQMGISKFKCCIEYAKSIPWSSGIVAGICNMNEYEELVKEVYSPISILEFPRFHLKKPFSDPRNWKKS